MPSRALLRSLAPIAAACLLASAVPTPADAVSSVAPNAGDALQWRQLGPFRGGWATMAAGDPVRPDTFYMSTAGGGLWKTSDAGRTWQPSSEGISTAAFGAIAIAPSNANVIYAGSGQVAARYDVGSGNGM